MNNIQETLRIAENLHELTGEMIKAFKSTGCKSMHELQNKYGTFTHEEKQEACDEIQARIFEMKPGRIDETPEQILLNKKSSTRLKEELESNKKRKI